MSEKEPHASSDSLDQPVPRSVEWIREHCLPILGLLTFALFVCLLAHYSSIEIDWATTNNFTGSVQNVVQIFALIVGGWWAYFKFIKGRTFQESLIPIVSGCFIAVDSAVRLVVTIQVRNIGSSKIDLNHTGSALFLFEYISTDQLEIHTVAANELASFDVLSLKNRCIEPNGIIEVHRFIAVPRPSKSAYRLEVEILSESGSIWTASTIVESSALRDNRPELFVKE
jgi:hypothetical protein